MTQADPKHGDFVLLRPSHKIYQLKPLMDPKIKAMPVSALWIPDSRELNANKKVCLHFHSGAFVLYTPNAPPVQWGPRNIAEVFDIRVLSVDYRLSCNADSHFPAALQDAVTAYKHLLDTGVPAAQIILSGDSSGANIVIALLRFIAEQRAEGEAKEQLPCPASAMLWSPWVDMSRNISPESHYRNAAIDFLPANLLAWGAHEYLPDLSLSSDPYFSPAKHPFRTESRLFVQAGSSEVMIDDIERFCMEMKRVPGNCVELLVVPNGVHDIFGAGNTLGFAEQAIDGVKAAKEFTDQAQ
ncbi:MAG: hypothetical protein M1828_002905 [Chrysothrix sp. TS-e1954]|nr:MAG: hypothetical protein M1828_002905 [Chrysothrix sp. TS-e1954]